MTRVAIFGGGVAGLSAAHELARLGYSVAVYEANAEAGGFFRSARIARHDGMPSEYSWHGLGPWYHNTFDVMRQTPFDDEASVYDKGLSRPIDFGLAPDRGETQFSAKPVIPVSKMFRMRGLDSVRWGWLLLKTWAANRRTQESYSRENAAEAWRPKLSELGWKTWRSCFGPWVGSDWTNVSLHQVGQFFRKQLMSGPSHLHAADADGPAWTHGSRDGWLLLRGPSSECWIDKWVEQLRARGVSFFWNQSLFSLDLVDGKIASAQLDSGQQVTADLYVVAANPFAVRDILKRTPELAQMDQLKLFEPLTQDGPHTQVSLRLAFSEAIAWPRERAVVIVADSEFNLTLCASEQIWARDVDLGDGVKALWTVTACVGKNPGRLFGRPVVECTKEEFIAEVMAQLSSCEGLDRLIEEANGGRGWRTFPLLRVEVWHDWLFSRDGIKSPQPKWVNTTRTQANQPTQRTPVPNLVLAGAHSKTSADVWSVEAAVESGRRAAQVFEPGVKVIPQHKALWLRLLSALDDVCYACGAPHFLDIVLTAFVAALVCALALLVYRGFDA